jgi:hypothetical protein
VVTQASRSRRLTAVLVGGTSLLTDCAQLLRDQGHGVTAVLSPDTQADGFDLLVSVANLRMLPQWMLSAPRLAAVSSLKRACSARGRCRAEPDGG